MILKQWLVAGNKVMGNAYSHPKIPDGTFVQFNLPMHRDDIQLKQGDSVQVAQGTFMLGEPL